MTTKMPQWAQSIRERIDPDGETTLIIAKRDHAEYLTLERTEIDTYFARQTLTSRLLKGALLCAILTLIASSVLFHASVLHHDAVLNEKSAIILSQQSAVETLLGTLSSGHAVEAFDAGDFTSSVAKIGSNIVAQREALEFMAEQMRVLAPAELESRLGALRESGIDPAQFFDGEGTAAVRGIGGARLADIAVLQIFFEDPVLELLAKLNDQAVSVDDLPTVTPILKGRITSRFGMRRHPITKHLQAHKGIDFVASTSRAEVAATHTGTVEFAGYEGDFGNVVKLRDDNGITSVYAHLSRINVKPGDVVERGAVLGNTGNTGMSTGSHLHYEVHYQGSVIDPLRLAGLRDVW